MITEKAMNHMELYRPGGGIQPQTGLRLVSGSHQCWGL